MKSYAGIGSRETPLHILAIFEKIGAFLATHGYTLRSGHAEGADQAFERGCDAQSGKKEIYIPWSGFEGSDSQFIVSDPLAFEIAAAYHPRWESLSQGAQKLQARNSHQVLGWNLKDPCKFVVCWTKNGLGKGGTGQALRLAEKNEIPIFDAGCFTNEDEVKRSFNDFFKMYK